MTRLFLIAMMVALGWGALASGKSLREFGAVPGDGKDDSDAIQAAIDATPVGGTLAFEAGEYDVQARLSFRRGRTYSGGGKAVLKKMGGTGWVADFEGGQGLKLEGLTFDGGGIYLGQISSEVSIVGCTFQGIADKRWPEGTAFFNSVGVNGLEVRGNHFLHINGATALAGYNWNNASVVQNEFVDCFEPLHHFWAGSGGKDIAIEHNRVTGVGRIGFEIQDQGEKQVSYQNLRVRFNRMTDFNSDMVPGAAQMALSIPIPGSRGTMIEGNYLDARGPHACAWGLEVEAGPGSEVLGNTFLHFENTLITYGRNVGVRVHDNFICGQSQDRWPILRVVGQPITKQQLDFDGTNVVKAKCEGAPDPTTRPAATAASGG